MKDYQLTIRIPVRAVDDPAARNIARSMLKDLDVAEIETLYSAKLQRLEPGKIPEGIAL